MHRLIILIIGLFLAALTPVVAQCYELYFTNEYGVGHYGYMKIYQNGTATLQVKYPDGYGGWACVNQTGRVVKYGNISGAEFRNPTICGTWTTNPYYVADNIYWWYDAYGRMYIYNIDDRAVVSGAWIKLVACNW